RPIHEALTADQASLDVTHPSNTYAHGRGCSARGEEKPGALVEVHGMPAHVVVWIDHKEARVFHVQPEAVDETTILSPEQLIHRHPKGRGGAKEHPDDATKFFHEVARAL